MKTKVYKKLVASVALVGTVLVGATTSHAYEVKKGDTLGNIALNHNTTVKELAELNPGIKNINLIYIGETIATNTNEVPVRKVASVSATTPVKVNANNNEVDLLSRIVEAEAKGESYAGKVAVAEVVLNRVASEQFPDTITGVIYQPGQFSPVANGSINKPASSDSKKAVNEAMASPSSNVGDSLFFYNSKIASNRWLDTKSTKAVIGNHTFK